MRWVTQARPKIDRLASPWLIRRFVDHEAEFLFVPAADVRNAAAAAGAVPFDVPGAPGVEFNHPPGGTTFDVIRERFQIRDPALDRVAAVVRDADNDNAYGRAPEAAGLRAISLGLVDRLRDDQQRLAHAMVMYDALYEWASRGATEDEVFARAPRLYHAFATIGTWLGDIRERRILRELDRFGLRYLYPRRGDTERPRS
jgi:hypothetical protein